MAQMGRQKVADIQDIATMQRGVVGAMTKHGLRAIREDLIGRPAVKKERTLIVELSFMPVPGEEGCLEDVLVDAQVKTRMPAQRTRRYSMGVTGDGFVTNELAPDDVKQHTFEEPKGERRT